MRFSLDLGEKSFMEWMELRGEEGMPAFKETCSIGYLAGSKILDVPYKNNNFNQMTRFHNYSFQIKENILIETVSLIGMHLHFENRLNEKEKEIFLSKMMPFCHVHYWEHFPRIDERELFQTIEKSLIEGLESVRSFPRDLITVDNEDYEVGIHIKDNYLFVQSDKKECCPEFLGDIIKQIKKNRMKLLFN